MDKTPQNQPARGKRIVLLYGDLDTLNLFRGQLEQGFSALGYEILVLDMTQDIDYDRFFEDMRKDPAVAAISFNSRLFGRTLPSGENMWEKETLGIPCINILVDHPYWYHEHILMPTPSTGIILCIDRNHMNYIERFYPNITCSGFLAHGGTSLCAIHKPISERKTDVLYAGSLKYTKIPKDFSGLDFPAKQIVEHLIAHPEDTIEAATEQELRQGGVILSDEELRKFIAASAPVIEPLVSSYYREKIVGSVAKAGIPLELYGKGWEYCDWVNLPNVHYGGMISPEEILLKMEDSKIVLNSMPWFRDGSHERVFNAMMCGAVALSETSQYLEEVLPPDTWISFDLSPESLYAMPQRVMDLLSDEVEMQKIASAGHALAVTEHSWKARALELHQDLLSQLP